MGSELGLAGTPRCPSSCGQTQLDIELASDVEGLRLVLVTVVGDRYGVRVSDDGSEVRLRRP
jgi:hypothetical protein